MDVSSSVARAVNAFLGPPTMPLMDAIHLHDSLVTLEAMAFALGQQPYLVNNAAGVEIERWRGQLATRVDDLVEVVRGAEPAGAHEEGRRALFLIRYEAENRPSLVPTLASAIRSRHQDII